jgi:predicted component of type VI protein secretion system
MLDWELRQLGALIDAGVVDAAGGEGSEGGRRTPGIQAHPFELFRQLVSLYADIFSYRAGPLQTMAGTEPLACLYRHDELMRCFGEVELAIEEELARPGAGSPEWAFTPLKPGSPIRVCNFPESLPLDAELYFLVQFEDDAREPAAMAQGGLDPRLLGLKLAAPERLESVHRRVLPGIPLERVKLVPFPHDFDASTVQFCRVKPGDEWAWAHAARAIAYDATGRPGHKSFLYCPNVRG